MGFPSGMDTYDPYKDPRVTPASKHAEPIASPSGSGKAVGGTDNMRANQSQKGPLSPPTAKGGKRMRPDAKGFDEFDGLSVK